MNTMKKQIVAVIGLLGLAALQTVFVQAQNTVSTTGYVTNENNVTMMVTQQVTTRLRRTTSQGDPAAKLNYVPGAAPEMLAVPLAETIMARYPVVDTVF